MQAVRYFLACVRASEPYAVGSASDRVGCAAALPARKSTRTCSRRRLWLAGCTGILWSLPVALSAIPLKIRPIVALLEEGASRPTQSEEPTPAQKEAATSALLPHESELSAKDASPNLAEEGAAEGADAHPEVPKLSNLQRAQLALDEVVRDPKWSGCAAAWYYRGVAYDRLFRANPAEGALHLEEALAAYLETMRLTAPATQFHRFALANRADLWNYHLERAIRCCKQGSLERALEFFATCSRILPDDPTPWLHAAMAYHANQQAERAWDCYKAYLKRARPSAFVFCAVANLLFRQFHAVESAVDWLDVGLLECPFDSELLEAKCRMYEASGRLVAYTAALQAEHSPLSGGGCAVEFVPNDSWKVFPGAGQIGIRKGPRTTRVQSWLGKWYGDSHSPAWIRPKDPKLNPGTRRYEYAYALEYQEKWEEASEQYRRISEEQPRLFPPLKQRALLQYRQAIQAASELQQWKELQAAYAKNTEVDPLGRSLHVWVEPVVAPFPASDFCPPLPAVALHAVDFLPKPSRFYRVHAARYGPYVASLSPEVCPWLLALEGGSGPTGFFPARMAQNVASALIRHRIHQTSRNLERQLQEAARLLQRARAENRKDPLVAEALYWTFHHLGRFRAAHRLGQIVARSHTRFFPTEDPFVLETQR